MNSEEIILSLKKERDEIQIWFDRVLALLEKASNELYASAPTKKNEHCISTYNTFATINVRALITKCKFYKENMQVRSEIDYSVVGVYKDDYGGSVTFELPEPVCQQIIEAIADELHEHYYDEKIERGA